MVLAACTDYMYADTRSGRRFVHARESSGPRSPAWYTCTQCTPRGDTARQQLEQAGVWRGPAGGGLRKLTLFVGTAHAAAWDTVTVTDNLLSLCSGRRGLLCVKSHAPRARVSGWSGAPAAVRAPCLSFRNP